MPKFEDLIGSTVLIQLAGKTELVAVQIESVDSHGIWFKSDDWEEKLAKWAKDEMAAKLGEQLVFFLGFSQIGIAVAAPAYTDPSITSI